MSEAGGSANINGILYQLLGTLDRAVALHLENVQIKNEEISSARLVIEPAGGGGDLQFEGMRGRRVEQWKGKARGGTWSLRQVVEEVVPDLYLAVVNDKLGADDEYAFITEGHIGKWRETYDFFRSLSHSVPLDDAFATLPDITQRHKLGKIVLTDRGLLEAILDKVRQRQAVAGEDETLSRRKLWHLLARFEMAEPLSKDRVIARVNDFLSAHVDILEEVDAKRRELCGLLLEWASKGEAIITPKRLLQASGIPICTFRNWSRLQSRMRDRLTTRLDGEKYEATMDVRASPIADADVTLIYGESGQGKTWHLARLAQKYSDDQGLVIWVPSGRVDADPLEYAAREIWNHGLERDAQLSLDRVAERFQSVQTSITSPWAVVCVDDVFSVNEARHIVNQPWQAWGMRVAITTTAAISRQLALSTDCTTLGVKDFSASELRLYLEKRGRSWVHTAHDVRELLRRPILAKFYADITSGQEWQPSSEYALMEAYWDHIENPVDIAALRRIATLVVEGGAQHPWPIERLLESGISEDSLARLHSKGWLRHTDDGHVAMWHTRLLCWAIAKSMVMQYQDGRIETDGLAELMCRYRIEPNLGYVPMDVLWLLFDPERTASAKDDGWRFITALEKHGGMGHEDKILYEHLLASLGERVIPHLIARVRESDGSDHNVVPTRAAETLLIVGKHASAVLAATVTDCLSSENAAIQELGLRLIVQYPQTGDVDRVWTLHKSNVATEGRSGEDFSKREKSAAAFRAVASKSPDWLRQQLLDQGVDHLVELVYTLANIDCAEAERIWRETKADLFNRIPTDKRRCLVGCIHRFLDLSELDRLEAWATSREELVGMAAIEAVAFLAPKRAITLFAKTDPKQMALITKSLAASCFASVPDAMSSALGELILSEQDGGHAYYRMTGNNGDQLDSKVLDLLIDWLDRSLKRYRENNGNGNTPLLWLPLSIVESLHGQKALDTLHARRGSDFEDRLCAFVCSRADNSSGWVDSEFDLARSILKRMAGSGFTKLANMMMIAGSRFARMVGCESAVVNPNEETRRLLRESALGDFMYEPNVPLIQSRAIDSLAAIGENGALIEAIIKWGLHISPDVGDLRGGQASMSDEEIRLAVDLMNQPDHPLHANAILAIGQSGRSEFQAKIEDILLASALDSPIAQASLLALEDIADDCSRILDRLVAQYQSGNYKFPVLKVLGKCHQNIPKSVYLRLLPDGPVQDDMDERVLTFLGEEEETRELVRERVRSHLFSRHGFGFFSDSSRLLDPRFEDEREVLWKKAAAPSGGSFVVGTKASAIKAISNAERESAFELALESFKTDEHDQELMPDLLMGLDAERAIRALCEYSPQMRNKAVCRAIALAIRSRGPSDEITPSLRQLLNSKNWKAGRAAAFLGGFQRTDIFGRELQDRASKGGNWVVCAECFQAIRRQQREAEAARLVQSLAERPLCELWGALDSIVELVDPDVLVMNHDPLKFREKLGRFPFAIRKYASDTLRKRREQIKKDLTSLLERWKDD